MKLRETFKQFQNEAEELFTEDRLVIVAPNSGYTLNYDEAEGGFIITDVNNKVKKRYKSFERAIDYLLENN